MKPLTAESCVVRGTHERKGRSWSVVPGPTASRHLHYGRIILDSDNPPVNFTTGNQETALICLNGRASVRTSGESFDLSPYDALYIPRDSAVEIRSSSDGCDLAEISAPVEKRYPLQFVAYADVQRDPGLHFEAGGPSAQRELNVLIGKNVEAGRLMAGVTFSKPGNWTS